MSSQDNTIKLDYITLSDGLNLRRLFANATNPEGTVILLHGFPETVLAWNRMANELSQNYDVHSFDWPGFGFSSRPDPDFFEYSPIKYAAVLENYIEETNVNKENLIIYATDISALPVLLLALREPEIAKNIIVGDFAPFDRPAYMNENLQGLKSKPSSDLVRAAMNNTSDAIIDGAFESGLPTESHFALDQEFRNDMRKAWHFADITTMDAFYFYYSKFTRDQKFFEKHIEELKTPVKVVWGELDLYIKKEMGEELAARIGAEFRLLAGIGHYPHLQSPEQAIEEIRGALAHRR